MKFCKVLLLLTVVSVGVATAGAQEGGIDADTEALIDVIEQRVVELRELDAVEDVPHYLWTPDEVRAWLIEYLDEQYPPEMAAAAVIFYNAFDFMPLDVDLRQLQLDVLAEQVGGFYEPETKQMVVVDLGGGFDALAELLHSHEYTHALQDQHFDLEALGLGRETDPDMPGDLLLARSALIEGDATQLMQDYLIWRVGQDDGVVFSMSLFGSLESITTVELEGAPPIINAELLFPYMQGQAFIQNVLARGGWVLVNAVYERPPLSTEQVMHPDQYFYADEPQVVDLALPGEELLGEAYHLVDESILGEFYLREYLAQHLPADDAALAAEGWGGDSFAIYHDDDAGETVWFLRVQWDAFSHATEFAEAFNAFATARYGDAKPLLEGDGFACWQGGVWLPYDAGDGMVMLRYDATCLYYTGTDTLIVQAPDLDTARAVGELQHVGE